MFEKFIDARFQEESARKITTCNEIIDNYLAQGLKLTLRQLYYQLVTRNIITNEEKSYKNLSTLVSNARLSGVTDWAAIEDRVRQPICPSEFENLNDLIEVASNAYRLPRWKGQRYYAELWVEKDALAGVLRPLARQFHVTMMVNRGYSSQSAMYDSSKRFLNTPAEKRLLFYLGDFDPSGEDMVRDIHERLSMFGADVEVKKIALTMKQIQKYKPPPNPAKMTDPRATAYVQLHGRTSWEVDALPPEVLQRIIQRELSSIIDAELMHKVIEQEERDKKFLHDTVHKYMKGKR